MRRAALVLTAALALLAAGCGGGGEKTGASDAAGGASLVPASATAFVSLNSDVEGEQWKQAEALLNKFPGRDRLLNELRSELREEEVDLAQLKRAVGPEVNVVWLDFANDGENVVGLTQPRDERLFAQLLAKGSEPTVHREIDGWTVFAETTALIDRFAQARGRGRLADDEMFTEATADLPGEALATFFVRGRAIREAADREAAQGSQGGVQPSEVIGDLEWVSGAATAEDDGARVDVHARGGSDFFGGAKNYASALASELPGGALLYLSYNDVAVSVRKAIQTASGARDLRETERDLGFSLERDVLPVFAREGGIVLYPGSPVPTVGIVQQVDDEAKARALLQKIEGPLRFFGGKAEQRRIGGATLRELRFQDAPFSILYGVVDGKLVVTNGAKLVRDLQGGGSKFSDDPGFRRARDAAGMPDETAGFVYADLENVLPLVEGLAQLSGERVPPDVRANLEPLRSLLVYGTRDGDRGSGTLFLEIE